MRKAMLWALAAAALLVITVSWKNWRKNAPEQTANQTNSSSNGTTTNPVTPALSVSDQQPDRADSETLMADSELSDFTLLPGALSADTADAAILRVRLQRSSLGSLGLPVNEERAAEWIQVDLLVGNDGLPQAVRLPQE